MILLKKKYLIAIFSLIVFSASLFLLTRFFRVNSLFARDGYFISGNAIDDVLLSSRKIGGSKNISLNSISSNDYFYQSIFGTLYVGEKKR